jgi:hypothetical protein
VISAARAEVEFEKMTEIVMRKSRNIFRQAVPIF